MKKCNKCNDIQQLHCFPIRKDSIDGYHNICKICTNKKQIERYQDPLVKQNEQLRHKKYYDNNNSSRRQYTKTYKRKSRKITEVRLRDNLRNRLNQMIKNNQRAGSAVGDLGCTVEELKSHLESQWQEGMNWDNHSLKGWHIDHIIPLASFDLTNRDQLLKACHYTNLQPLWAEENWSKGANLY